MADTATVELRIPQEVADPQAFITHVREIAVQVAMLYPLAPQVDVIRAANEGLLHCIRGQRALARIVQGDAGSWGVVLMEPPVLEGGSAREVGFEQHGLPRLGASPEDLLKSISLIALSESPVAWAVLTLLGVEGTFFGGAKKNAPEAVEALEGNASADEVEA